MSTAHQRKKHPEAVRQQLLAVTARLLIEEGPGSVTLDAVARAAGVSKGGLLHHFPSKPALLDGLFDDLTEKFDGAIAERMRDDPDSDGRFTRAYISVCFAPEGLADAEEWTALTVALISEPRLRERLGEWTAARAATHGAFDATLEAMLVRYVVDGVWLSDLLGAPAMTGKQRHALRERLFALSHP